MRVKALVPKFTLEPSSDDTYTLRVLHYRSNPTPGKPNSNYARPSPVLLWPDHTARFRPYDSILDYQCTTISTHSK